ncbi:hypothetical protein [Microbacterium sp. NPDC097977]|uniref:hypothetical protein n=1 Tax=Microbacterium sp. NPDC097977 TaxID=3155686 RepID=UPI00332A6303
MTGRNSTRKTAAAAAIFLMIVTMTLTSCSAGADPAEVAATATATPPATSEPVATQAAEPPASESQSASDGFREWLDASRLPDVDTACARLTPDLVTRMIAELESHGMTGISSCEQMITATADLYRPLGQSAEVDIAVQTETATDATLFVTYLASGDCGTVVMERRGTAWILTDQSMECGA